MLSSNLLKCKIPICGGGVGEGSRNMMLSSNLLESKIPIYGGGGMGGFVEFDAEFKFAKIQNSHLWGGLGGGFVEFDGEFKFAKNQNSHLCVCVCVCVWGGGFQLLMLSPNLVKKNFFCEKFSKFSGKNWNGFVLGFEYRVVRYTKYSEPQLWKDSNINQPATHTQVNEAIIKRKLHKPSSFEANEVV